MDTRLPLAAMQLESHLVPMAQRPCSGSHRLRLEGVHKLTQHMEQEIAKALRNIGRAMGAETKASLRDKQQRATRGRVKDGLRLRRGSARECTVHTL